MKHTTIFLSCTLLMVACKSKDKKAKPDHKNSATQSNSKTEAPPTPKPEQSLKAVDAEGRCDNQTPDTPYDALFFYPSRGELFMPSKARSAFRLPIRVRAESGPNVEFNYKWSDDESKPGSDHPGAATAREDNAIAFRFDTLKPTLCEHSEYVDFYAPVTKLDVTAGLYFDAEHDDEIEIFADEQKILSNDKGKKAIAYYRVKAYDPDSITLYVANNPPDDSRPTVWVEWTLATAGETLTIDYMGKFTRSYQLRK